MLFLPLHALGVVLYIIGHRVSATLIFFFFLTDGFQLIPYPEVLFNTYMGISKGIDLAFIYAFVLFLYGLWRYDDFLPKSLAAKLIFGYTGLLLLLSCISLFYYRIPVSEVLRTVRPFLLVYAYFPFRRLTSEQYEKVFLALWWITLGLGVLFILQSITGFPILSNANSGGTVGIFTRFYNFPIYCWLFAFVSIFHPFPRDWRWRYLGITVCSMVVILGFSRAALAQYAAVILFGWLLTRMSLRRILWIGIPTAIVAGGLFVVALGAIQGGRTMADFQRIMEGEIVETVEAEATAEFSIEEDNTLLFRLSTLFERFLDVVSTPQSIVWGKGLSAESSPYTESNFSYYLGLSNPDTGGILQVYNPDISWPSLLLRYGIVGTIIYLTGFFLLMGSFLYRSKALFLYGLMLLFNSIASECLYWFTFILPLFIFFDRGVPSPVSGGGIIRKDAEIGSIAGGCESPLVKGT